MRHRMRKALKARQTDRERDRERWEGEGEQKSLNKIKCVDSHEDEMVSVTLKKFSSHMKRHMKQNGRPQRSH